MKLLVGNLVCGKVNLFQNDYASGLPSPFSCLGFADAIGHACGFPRWSTAVLPVIHDLQVSSGRTKPELKRSEKSGGKFAPVEIMESMTGHVEISFILDLPDVANTTKVEEFMKTARFAGSLAFPGRGGFKITEIRDGSEDIFKVRRGYAFLPASFGKKIAAPVSFGEPESLKALRDKLILEKRESGSGWVVPAAVGYRYLEDPKFVAPRKATRNPSIPHAFVEPGVSTGELVSIRNKKISDLNPENFDQIFWRWSSNEKGIFAHEIYT